ncbi:hypothetical protein KBA01_26170 [Kozakia baliensis]|nr:hypothetical protein KBA01_26170 [Kozakia baliensis]
MQAENIMHIARRQLRAAHDTHRCGDILSILNTPIRRDGDMFQAVVF